MNSIISILPVFSLSTSARMLDSSHPVILILHGSYRQQFFFILIYC